MRQQWVRTLVGLLFLFVIAAHVFGRDIDFIVRLESFAYDLRVRLTAPGTVDDRVVILTIDEKSLAEQGHWPWGRDKLARLVDILFDKYKVDTLGFDVTFSEADESGGIDSLERLAQGELKGDVAYQRVLQRLRPQLDHDARFAAALKNRRVILGFSLGQGAPIGSLPGPVLHSADFLFPPDNHLFFSSYTGNLPLLQSAAAGAGHMNPTVDPDGVIRRVPLLLQHQGRYYESFSLAMVRAVLGFPAVEPLYAEPETAASEKVPPAWLRLQLAQPLDLPVDDDLSALVPYRGGARSFRYVPLTDILNERLPPQSLAGKVVLVGATAPGLRDQRVTPVSGNFPGVEIHANLIAGMLDGNLRHQPTSTVGVELMVLAFLGFAMIYVLPRRSPLMAIAMTCALVLVVIGGNVLFWQAGLVVPLAASLVLIMTLFALNMSWGFFAESRSNDQFAELFGQYVPPELVDEMVRDPRKYNMEGRRAELTVMFADIFGFTSIAEGLSPEELAALLNEYLSVMTNVIQSYRGTLDKYMGDAIMAFWGAPVHDIHHARNAVLAAMDMQKALQMLNGTLLERGQQPLEVGIGINTGLMTVGDMGSHVRKVYTVLGDSVNLASRLEGLTRFYGAHVLVGAATRDALRKEFVFRELDRVRVKGKEDPVAIYEPLGMEGRVGETQLAMLRLWHQVLRAYRAQNWEQAEQGLESLRRMGQDPLFDLYSARIAEYRKHPPGADWDGVTTFESK